ncbi:Acb2/Tad1 domain-containing protein [Sphingomonas sp. MMS24-JH45]
MRHTYRVLSDTEKAQMVALKDAGAEMLRLIGEAGSSRELSIARTKTEEAVMWAVKHVTA